MRGVAASLFVLMVGLLLAPALVLLEFHADRERIARELCVQREVVEEMRTCHGECQLSKRLRALEHEADAPFPMERIELRFEPLMPLDGALTLNLPIASARAFPICAAELLDRPLPVPDGVPWRC
ncbi:MAG: hypothetical protein R2817_05000 [Flavobacteriales bacterium]